MFVQISVKRKIKSKVFVETSCIYLCVQFGDFLKNKTGFYTFIMFNVTF